MKKIAFNPCTFDPAAFNALYSTVYSRTDPENGWYSGDEADGRKYLYFPDRLPDVPQTVFPPPESLEDKLKKPIVSTIINALEAGTATNAQVQNILAKVLRYLRCEAF